MGKSAGQRAKLHGERAVGARRDHDATGRPAPKAGYRGAAPAGRPSAAGTPGTTPGTVSAPRAARGSAEKSSSSLILIAALVMTVALFAYLYLYVMNQMTQLSHGLAMPDMRMLGFNVADAQQLRGAMDPNARGQLSFTHKTAGLMFALMFALTFALLVGTSIRPGAGRAAPGGSSVAAPARWLRRFGWVLAALFLVLSLAQYVAVDAILGAAQLTGGAVALASSLVVAHWVLLWGLLLLGLLLVLARAAGSRGRGNRLN